MKTYKVTVYGPKGHIGCVSVTVQANSITEARKLGVARAQVIWWQIPAAPKTVVQQVVTSVID